MLRMETSKVPPPEVVHRDGALLLLIEAVGEGGCCGLVDDAEHLQAGQAGSVTRRLTLGVIEVRGDGDDGAEDLCAAHGDARLGGDLPEDQGRDLLGREALAADLDLDQTALGLGDLVGEAPQDGLIELSKRAAHEALDAVDGVSGVVHGPSSRRPPDDRGAVVGDVDHGGDERCLSLHLKDLGPTVLPDRGK